MRCHAADHGVVLGVAGGVDLAVQKRAGKRVEGEVDRVDRLEDVDCVARDRRMPMVGVHPLHRLGRPDDLRARLAELDRERIDHLDLARREAGEHRRELGHGTRARLHPHAFAALAGVIQLEEVLLGGGLLGDGGGRGHGSVVVPSPTLQELERHGTSKGVAWT